jgi:hypothetical protein
MMIHLKINGDVSEKDGHGKNENKTKPNQSTPKKKAVGAVKTLTSKKQQHEFEKNGCPNLCYKKRMKDLRQFGEQNWIYTNTVFCLCSTPLICCGGGGMCLTPFVDIRSLLLST